MKTLGNWTRNQLKAHSRTRCAACRHSLRRSSRPAVLTEPAAFLAGGGLGHRSNKWSVMKMFLCWQILLIPRVSMSPKRLAAINTDLSSELTSVSFISGEVSQAPALPCYENIILCLFLHYYHLLLRDTLESLSQYKQSYLESILVLRAGHALQSDMSSGQISAAISRPVKLNSPNIRIRAAALGSHWRLIRFLYLAVAAGRPVSWAAAHRTHSKPTLVLWQTSSSDCKPFCLGFT